MFLEGQPSRVDLGPMSQLYQSFGSPADGIKIIHVTGTNGKGTTCRKLARALQLSGHKVGLYLTPHLLKVGCIHNHIRSMKEYPSMGKIFQMQMSVDLMKPHVQCIKP